MADNHDTLRQELDALCRHIPESTLLRVVRFAREAVAAPDTDSQVSPEPDVECQRRVAAMESWLSLAPFVGEQIPSGATVVGALEEDRNERQLSLRGRR